MGQSPARTTRPSPEPAERRKHNGREGLAQDAGEREGPLLSQAAIFGGHWG